MGMWLNRITQNNHGWMTEARAAPQTTGPCHQGWWSFTTWKQKFSYSLRGTCQVRFLLHTVSWRPSWRLFAVQLEFHLLEVYVWIVVVLLGAPMGRLFGACNLEVFHWNKQRLFLGCPSSLAELFLHSLASLVDIVVSKNGGIPIAGWLILWKIPSTNGWWLGVPLWRNGNPIRYIHSCYGL